MTPEEFLKEFGALAETEGIAALRQMALSLGLSGRFGLGHAGDPGASSLLRDVTRLPLEGNGRPLPKKWEWVRLDMVVDQRLGKMLDKAKNKGVPQPYLRNLNVQWFRFELDDILYMRIEPDEEEELLLRDGDLLVCEGGEPGRAAVWRDTGEPMFFQKALHRIRPRAGISPEYLAYRFRLDTWTGTLERLFTGATIKHLTGKALRAHEFPLPPVPEQQRIVEKVDQLMALCDELEAAQKKRRATSFLANKAALSALTSATGTKPMKEAWKRVQDNFEVLYDAPETVQDLRQSILQLAVMGKLTHGFRDQQPDISPSRAPSHFAPLRAAEARYEVPRSWSWSRFDAVATIRSNLVSPAAHPDLPHIAPDNIEKHTGRLLPYRTVREDGVRSSKHLFFAGHILYSKIRPNLCKIVTVDFGGLCSADMYPIEALIDKQYLHRFMLSRVFVQQVTKDDNRLAMPKVNQEQLNAVAVAVPPPAEQRRIVAKVDHLMALCDELDALLQRSRTDGEALMKAVVEHLVTAPQVPSEPIAMVG